MTNNIPQICAAFEIWQENDCINAGTTLEIIMRYLADDPEIDYVVSDADRLRAYRDYIGRQQEQINAKTLIIRELNKDREASIKAFDELNNREIDMDMLHNQVYAKEWCSGLLLGLKHRQDLKSNTTSAYIDYVVEELIKEVKNND